MEINLGKKAQARLILALAVIVLLSTLILAAVAINESNETDKSNTNPNVSSIDLNEPVIEITPFTESSNEEVTDEPQSEATLDNSSANEEDVSITLCGDNQDYAYNESLNVGWSNGNDVFWHNGGYQESVFTYEAFSQCVISMDPYEVDMNCLTEQCTEIVKLNQLTGEVKTIWRQGNIW